jgi:hypothetical protein
MFFYSIFQNNFIIRVLLIFAFLTFIYYIIIQKHLKIKSNKSNYFIQKVLTQLELNQFKSHQLIRPKNIKIIEELNISINIEHSKYVHLQIKDFNKKRWEVPHEILNEEYFRNINKINNAPSFEMEYLKSNENFYFNLYFNSKNEKGIIDKNIFYKFNILQNFLFSNNYINFESQLTTDNIYGFGERIHNFKLNKGLYTI